MTIYTVIDILTALFESFLFNMLFQSLFKERERVSKYIYIIAVVLLAVAIVFSNRLFNFGYFKCRLYDDCSFSCFYIIRKQF